MKRLLSSALALTLLAASVLAQDEIKIGEFASLTGGSASFGQSSHKGTQLAFDEINAAVNDCGLGTAEVDVAPMALYNAFRATYGHPDEAVLLIDIGAKTSNLLYIEGKRFFTRSIAIGGAAITAAIAKEYNIPFLEAEHQKISNGLVALGGGHTEQMDEAVASLAMVIRNALSRLPAEIARSRHGSPQERSLPVWRRQRRRARGYAPRPRPTPPASS
jgi:cell division ATPase FtsA